MIHFEPRRKISIYASFIAIFLVASYTILRTGLDLQLNESLKTAGFILSLLNIPILFIESVTIKSKYKILKDEYALMTILLITFCVPSIFSIDLGYFFVLLGSASLSKNLFSYLKTANSQEFISWIFLPAIVVWLSITVWKGDYVHPMLLERLAFDDRIHIDTLYHISFAQMIKTYGIPSTGLNGIPFIPYHFGSHLLFACISKVLNIHLFTFYQLSYPVIFLPLIFKAMAGLPIVFSEKNTPLKPYNTGFMFWAILLAALIGVFPVLQVLTKATLEIPGIIVSESYNISLALLFILLNIIVFNFSNENSRSSLDRYSLSMILLLTFLIGVTKISTLMVFNALALYFFFRLGLYRQKSKIIFTLFLGLISILCMFLTIDQRSGDGSFEIFHFFRTYVKMNVVQFVFVYYFWSLLLIAVCIAMIIIHKTNKTQGMNKFYFTILEATLLVSVAGSLPGLLLNVADGSAGYFMNVQMWISVGLLLSVWPHTKQLIVDSVKRIPLTSVRLLIAILLLLMAFKAGAVVKHNFKSSFTKFMEHNVDDKAIITGEATERSDKLSLKEKMSTIVFLNSKLRNSLSKNEIYGALYQLYQMGEISISEKNRSILVCRNMNTLNKNFPCYKYPFLIPALSGIAAQNGFVFEDCNGKGYGFEYYKREFLNDSINYNIPSNKITIDIQNGKVVTNPILEAN